MQNCLYRSHLAIGPILDGIYIQCVCLCFSLFGFFWGRGGEGRVGVVVLVGVGVGGGGAHGCLHENKLIVCFITEDSL